jgi:Protein of unknown function (DUF2384)
VNTVEDSRIVSPFSSSLTKLDENLRIIQTQTERLRAGLDFNEDQLRRSLAEACQCATILSDLISAQRSDANEIDEAVLDRLVHELKTLRRVQRRRLKLLNLAMELRDGRVRHHRVNRTEALNELRLRAVNELLEMATSSSQQKELPGPTSGKWMHWACGLQTDTEGMMLEALRRDFPAVEEFLVDIDEQHWVPSETHGADFSSEGFSSEEAAGAAEESDGEPLPGAAGGTIDAQPEDYDRLARELLAIFQKIRDVGKAEGHSASNENPVRVGPPPSELPAIPDSDSGQTKTVPPGARKGDSRSAQGPAFTWNDRPILKGSGRLQKAQIDKTAARDFMKVVNAWQLNDGQARQLAGIPRTQFRQLREGKHVSLEPDKLTRISLLAAICKGLTVLYGTRRGDKWVHRPHSNPLFDGATPLKYMLKEGVEGLVKVRELVGTWSL